MCENLKWDRLEQSCPCRTPFADCAQCKTAASRWMRHPGGASPHGFTILQDNEGKLHVHERTPTQCARPEIIQRVIQYRNTGGGQWVAALYVSVGGELIALHANLPVDDWLILMPYEDQSRIWETPGQVFDGSHKRSGVDIMRALRAEKELITVKFTASGLTAAVMAGFDQASTKTRSTAGELAILQAMDESLASAGEFEGLLSTLRHTNAGLRAIATR